MATSAATPIHMSSPSTSMNPTTTEHDFRFPRRPFEGADGGSKPDGDGTAISISGDSGAGDLGASLQEFKWDLDSTYHSAQNSLFKTDAFPTFRDGMAGMSDSPEDLQRQDPLATQVWRFFSKTKQMLPNQERMENLTWRMMHMNMRKQAQIEEAR